jgi:hypothetical protein
MRKLLAWWWDIRHPDLTRVEALRRLLKKGTIYLTPLIF